LRPKQYFALCIENFEYWRGRQPAAPPGPRPFDPSLSAENQELSPPLLFLFSSRQQAPPQGGTPISCHLQLHTKGDFGGDLLLPHSSGQRPTVSCPSSFQLISAIFSSFSPAPTTPIFPYFLSFSADSTHSHIPSPESLSAPASRPRT